MRVFLFSPYHSGSHRAWAEGYARHSRHEVRVLAMAGRFWKWRMQGGALELAARAVELCRQGGAPDVLLATDMANLPALLALARPWLDGAPAFLYAHENQLTYPPPPGEKRDLTYGMINTLSMACAQFIAFNSRYHHDAYFEALPRLLKHFPDYNHLRLLSDLQAKSRVLPVGIDLAALGARPPGARGDGPLRILWNQRWEYDKNPAEFFAALDALAAEGLPFEVIVAGENFRQRPEEFAAARARLGDRVRHWGYARDLKAYARLLWQADVVISTALHEFFGVSVLEAIHCGCYPLLPRRLSYPELLPDSLHEDHLYDGFTDLVERLKSLAAAPALARERDLAYVAAPYGWSALAPRYDRWLEGGVDRG